MELKQKEDKVQEMWPRQHFGDIRDNEMYESSYVNSYLLLASEFLKDTVGIQSSLLYITGCMSNE